MTACSVPECGRPVECRELCTLHYQRLRTHGDTSTSKHPKPERFSVAIFYAKALAYTGSECLIWPFGRNSAGYATMSYKGKNGRVEMVFDYLERAGYAIVARPLGECICPKCGVRHGLTSDPDDLVPF